VWRELRRVAGQGALPHFQGDTGKGHRRFAHWAGCLVMAHAAKYKRPTAQTLSTEQGAFLNR
jgi:hypothetical protein